MEEISQKGRGEQLRVRERQKITMGGGDSSRGWNRLSDVAPALQGTKGKEEYANFVADIVLPVNAGNVPSTEERCQQEIDLCDCVKATHSTSHVLDHLEIISKH